VHERIDLARGVIAGEDRVIIQGHRLPLGAGHVLIWPPAPTVIQRAQLSRHDQSTIFA
jgi:hypothetical protein